MARGIVAICRPKRRRAGGTALGFQKALCRLPMWPLAALAGALCGRLLSLLGDGLLHGGFIPLGCDGSRLECCRNDELIARMGQAGKEGSSPTMWVTAVAHLTTGVPWSWWLGRGDASERDHLERLLPSLPKKALVVTDTGYDGYDLAVAILASGASFLIRMSSKTHLFVDELTDPERFSQGGGELLARPGSSGPTAAAGTAADPGEPPPRQGPQACGRRLAADQRRGPPDVDHPGRLVLPPEMGK